MFFLFGWGHRTKKDYGQTLPMVCPNCNNKCFWKLLHIKTWFSLFFIPVIPYESKNYLLCEVCSQGIELKESQIGKAKEANELTLSFLNKAISEDQYKIKLKEIDLLGILEKDNRRDKIQREEVASRLPKVCPECGKGYEDSWKVCLECERPLIATQQRKADAVV